MVSQSGAENVTLIWERAEPVAKGAAAAPRRDQMVAVAFEIADREGLHAVSVKRVASKLRIPSLRLESYLTSREDLLDLMLDGALGEIEPAYEGDDWRSQLRAIAHATQTTARRHPWLRALAGTRTPCGPNGLRHNERALAALNGLGLDASAMTQAVNTVLAYVYGYVQLEMLEPGRKMDEAVEAERGAQTARYLMAQVQTGEYPTLAHVFADATHLTAADAFETGLNYVLDGIGTHLSEPAPGARVVGNTGGNTGSDTASNTGSDTGEESDASADPSADSGSGRHLRRGRRRAPAQGPLAT